MPAISSLRKPKHCILHEEPLQYLVPAVPPSPVTLNLIVAIIASMQNSQKIY